jgi:hypothetical protein
VFSTEALARTRTEDVSQEHDGLEFSFSSLNGKLEKASGGTFPKTRERHDLGICPPLGCIEIVYLQQNVTIANSGGVGWTVRSDTALAAARTLCNAHLRFRYAVLEKRSSSAVSRRAFVLGL